MGQERDLWLGMDDFGKPAPDVLHHLSIGHAFGVGFLWSLGRLVGWSRKW
ncbi:MAG: hypothetical protein QY328_13790 [Anaerolineales bacterium]|nr:MAG: hypothetical protein QY328_13790 [Anaerolineales bacterium]